MPRRPEALPSRQTAAGYPTRNQQDSPANMLEIMRPAAIRSYFARLVPGLFVILVAAAGCGAHGTPRSAPEPEPIVEPSVTGAEVADWVGCYDLELGRWSPEMELGADSIFIAFPPRILLDSVPAPNPPPALPVEPGQEQLAVHPAPESPPSPQRFSSWRKVESDSIQIVWVSYSGVRIQLGRGEDVHHGYARTGWDFPGRVQTAPVAARRVSCSSPMPEEHASYRRFPREVRLNDGRSIVLGERLPDDPRGVESPPVGLFAGAEVSIVRQTSDGVVYHIELGFPPGSVPDDLEERFIDVYGPPTTLRDGGRFVATWWGRDTVSYLTIGEREPGVYSARFLMIDPRLG
jgi:hypothetical protein